MRAILAMILTLAALAGCSNQGLRDLRTSASGPDEFMVDPKKTLQTPASFAALPAPTPGAGNLADTNPRAEAIAALGGALAPTAVPRGDSALIAAAGRFGADPDIRATLAANDADFRRRKGRFTQYRIVSAGLYDQIYKREALDAYAEARRWRRAGISTPSYPPDQ
jgi:hypothetical protein